jgi:hypothetical protein
MAQASVSPPVTTTAAAITADAIRGRLPVPVVTVRSGQYLSKIAQEDCGDPADWTGIFAANREKISNPDRIYPGEQLKLNCHRAPVPAITTTTTVTARPQYRSHYVPPVTSEVIGTAGMGGFQSCVIARESGGRTQVMNSSGHYGLYQFSSSTWAAPGGNPSDFGRASASEQTQVFWNTVHADGTSDWAPYDGC